jgi:hypothetical protein
MSPQKQLAQKLNAAFSTGPRTAEGKTKSSQNRVSHGLCSTKHAIHVSQRPEFERHYNEMLAALAPVGAEEAQLAEAIILDQYRMARARELENEIFVKGIADAKDQCCPSAETWAKNSKDLALLTLYSQRIHRVLIRNQADFAAKQTARKASETAQPKTQAAAAEPAVGFVHSPAPETPVPSAIVLPTWPLDSPETGAAAHANLCNAISGTASVPIPHETVQKAA